MNLRNRSAENKPAENSSPLADPVIVGRFWKNRARKEHVRIELSEFEGRPLVNVRVWTTGSDGIDRPSPKGIALGISKLPELAKMLGKAVTKARELNLLEDGDE